MRKVQPSNNLNIDKTFPAGAYSCLQVCVKTLQESIALVAIFDFTEIYSMPHDKNSLVKTNVFSMIFDCVMPHRYSFLTDISVVFLWNDASVFDIYNIYLAEIIL